jgi:hypothetical protein
MAMPPDLAPPLDFALPPGQLFKFVLDTVTMPDSAVPEKKFLYDVDGNGDTENQLAVAANLINSSGASGLQAPVDAALRSGTLLQLLQIQSRDPALMNDSPIGVSGYVGATPTGQDPTMDLTGHAMLDVDPTDEPAQHALEGSLVAGTGDTFHLPAGAFPIRLPISPDQPPVPMTLYAAHARFEAQTRAAGDAGTELVLRNGMLNGGLQSTEIHQKLIPAIAQLLNSIIVMNPTGTQARTILALFNENPCRGPGGACLTGQDNTIEPMELEDSTIVQNALKSDLDLFDAQGNFNPNSDQVMDSVSMGVGFTGVGAVFPDQM